jgi:hypothetical protein
VVAAPLTAQRNILIEQRQVLPGQTDRGACGRFQTFTAIPLRRSQLSLATGQPGTVVHNPAIVDLRIRPAPFQRPFVRAISAPNMPRKNRRCFPDAITDGRQMKLIVCPWRYLPGI